MVVTALDMSPSERVNGFSPVVLLLGEIVLAHDEWDLLKAMVQLRVGRIKS